MRVKALITGVTGMVGSHLVDFLLENTDWEIYGMCRWRSPLDNVEHVISRVEKKDRIFFLYGDLNDYISLSKVTDTVKPDYVFHLAAQSYPKTSFDSPVDTYNTNIIGTANLLEALKKTKEIYNIDPVIHVCSSSEVFGRVPKNRVPIDENESFHPASPYAISKAGTDLIGRFYAEAYNMRTVITRMFTHTGPRRGDVFAESTFAKQIAMIEKKMINPVVKVGNLNSMRTYADVRDAVRAYYMLVTIKPIPGEVYNIGGSYSCTVGDMLNYLISISKEKNIEIKIDEERLRPIDADLQIPNTKKFYKHTGWKPNIPFEKTMEDLLNYWRNQLERGRKYLVR